MMHADAQIVDFEDGLAVDKHWRGDDGVAVAFVFPQAEDARRVTSIVAEGVGLADKKTLDVFLQPLWVNRPIGPGGGSL